jgi:hypothetical protein
MSHEIGQDVEGFRPKGHLFAAATEESSLEVEHPLAEVVATATGATWS